jgi:hypothetical protein
MAFRSRYFKSIASAGTGNFWGYKSDDSLASASATGYFNDSVANLNLGDIINITVVTNLDLETEAYADSGEYVVTALSPNVTIATTNPAGGLVYAITDEETALSITPDAYEYPPADFRRYGGVGNGSTDDTTAVQTAFNVSAESVGKWPVICAGGNYKITTQIYVAYVNSADYDSGNNPVTVNLFCEPGSSIVSYVTGTVGGINNLGYAIVIDGMRGGQWEGLKVDFINGTAGVLLQASTASSTNNRFINCQFVGGTTLANRYTATKIGFGLLAGDDGTDFVNARNHFESPAFDSMYAGIYHIPISGTNNWEQPFNISVNNGNWTRVRYGIMAETGHGSLSGFHNDSYTNCYFGRSSWEYTLGTEWTALLYAENQCRGVTLTGFIGDDSVEYPTDDIPVGAQPPEPFVCLADASYCFFNVKSNTYVYSGAVSRSSNSADWGGTGVAVTGISGFNSSSGEFIDGLRYLNSCDTDTDESISLFYGNTKNPAPALEVFGSAAGVVRPYVKIGIKSAGTDVLIEGGSDSTNIDIQPVSAGNNVILGDGAWNGKHVQFGTIHLWVDSSNRLRIKTSAPSSDTDGTIVGTQT